MAAAIGGRRDRAHGDPATVMQRVQEHLAAGADHVCIQVLTDTPAAIPWTAVRQLARVLARRLIALDLAA